MGRRFFAHLWDVLLFIIVETMLFKVLDVIIYNNELTKLMYALVVPISLLFIFLVYGLFASKSEATLGEFIEKLRVVATKGHLTTARLFVKNLLALLVYVPLIFFLADSLIILDEITSFSQIKDHLDEINLNLLVVSLVLILLNAILNIFLYSKFKQSVTDRIFDTKVVYRKQKEITFSDFSKLEKPKKEKAKKELNN